MLHSVFSYRNILDKMTASQNTLNSRVYNNKNTTLLSVYDLRNVKNFFDRAYLNERW